MARAAYARSRFFGGEWSEEAQGNFEVPEYRSAMRRCLNTVVMESGGTQRRPGTRFIAQHRSGFTGRNITFDFTQSAPYQMLFTPQRLRFAAQTELAGTNDDATITAISTADPAVVTISAARSWANADMAFINSNVTQLMNRQVLLTPLTTTTYSIVDGITGISIDGSTLDTFTSGTIRRIQEVVTPYLVPDFANLRSVQAETTALLLNGAVPQVLTVTQQPSDTVFAQFALNPADFLDGPYLDPFPGSYITASAKSGVVTLTLSFQSYDPTRAYSVGDYVTYSGQGYRSISANNQNRQPDVWPAYWRPVNAGDPINGGAGFISADIGRLIRLFSEPPLWDSGATYSAGQVVAYAASGDAIGYYLATGSISAGVKPGTSLSWSIVTGASVAIWTWGSILSISTSGVTAPDSYIGNLTGGGGIASAFDGNASKSFASSANVSASTTTYPLWQPAQLYLLTARVNFGGTFYEKVQLTNPLNAFQEGLPPPVNLLWQAVGTASNISFGTLVGGHLPAPTQIASVTVSPPIDTGFTSSPSGLVLNLRAKATVPANASDGTLLGTTGAIGNTASPISIVSNDQSTAYNYVWVELNSNYNQPLPDDGSHTFAARLGVAQARFFAPNIANGSVIEVQILGDPLLYTDACRKWRLGAYGGTNGYPTNGTYSDGRIWLSGVEGNRFDASKSNVIRNGVLTLNMAPTLPDGTVTDDSGITERFTGEDVNQILWMKPELQGIVCGTQGGEWLIFAPGQGAISPTNIDARRVTKIGCANILPVRTDHTLVFVQKFLRELQEYFADVYSGKFSSPQLNKNAKHMTVPNVLELAYQQQKASIVWARLANGNFIGVTYQRDTLTTAHGPNISGAHRHALGSSRVVRSIATGASSGGNLDSLYLTTEDQAGGNFQLEILTDLLDEGFALTDAWCLDSAMRPAACAIEAAQTGAPYGGLRLYGLWPLNGKTVAAWLCGLDCGSRGLDSTGQPIIQDFAVSNGSILVPFGDGISQGCGDGLFTEALATPFIGTSPLPMVVGFPYTSDGQCVRPIAPQEAGSRLGPALGLEKRTHKYAALLYGCITRGIFFGTDFDHLLPAEFRLADDQTKIARNVLFSGVHKDLPDADSDLDNGLCWRVTRPHPAFVNAIEAMLQTQDE